MKKIYALFMTLCLIISATAAPLAGVAKKSYPLYQPEVVKAELALDAMQKAPAATQGLQYDAEAGELIRYYNETDQIAIDATYLADGQLNIDIVASDLSDMLSLVLFVEDTVEGTIIPEGTYPVTSTPAYGTAYASPGVKNGSVYPSFYGMLTSTGGIKTPLYFLESGNVVVEVVDGNVKISIDAANSNNVPMTIVYEVGGKSEKVEVKTPLQYDATAADGALDYTFAEGATATATDKGFYGTYVVDAADASSELALLFIYPEGVADAETTIPAGTYTISDSQAAGTVMASSGYSSQGLAYSFFININAENKITLPMYFLVEGTVEVTKVDGKLKVEVNGLNSNDVPVHVVYDATPAEEEEVTVPTNAELWEAFKPYYNTYYGLTRADQPIDKVSTFASAKMQEIMTDAASEYKWLGDYILGVAAGQGVNLPTDMAAANEGAWRWAVHAFFNATTGANGAAGTDFTEAGKPENWGPYYLAAQEGTTPEPEPVMETVYFVNAANWTTVNVYAWTTDPNASWPGVAATKEAEQIAGYDVYSYTVEAGTYANVIFNNGSGQQTADLVWTAGKYYVKDGWYTKEEAEAKLAKPAEYESVYFVDNQGWGKANIYTWTPEVGTWPGVAMTKEAEQLAGYDVYSYTVEKGTSFGGVIFNNGSGVQTGDLKWTAGKYYVKDAWYTKEEAEAKLAGPVTPPVITYVLMGVKGDWTTGIAMTVNPDNENEYMLLGQEILEGDAVKVVTLTDGVATAWCGNVDEYSVERSYDENGNIVLAPGKYDFYYKVAEDLIYIGGEAYKPEIEWLEMPLEITNLTTEVMEVEGAKYLLLQGRDDMNDADVMLFLNNYADVDDDYEVNAESSYMTFGGLELTVLEGVMTQTSETDKGTVYNGIVRTYVAEDSLYVAFNLTMYAAPATVLELTDAIVAINEELGTLTFNVPTGEGEGYFVELSGYTAPGVHEGPQICLLETPEAVAFANYAETSVADGVITLKGEFTSFMGAKFDLTISGKLPVEEPVEKPEPTYTENNLNPYAFGLESKLSDDKTTLTVTYRLNNSNATKADVIVKNGQDTIVIVAGTTNIGKNTVEISTEGFPTGVDITWAVIVNGTSVEAPTREEKIYSFYHPSGLDIDINPENETFGMLLVNEGMHSVKDKTEGYVSAQFGAGIFAFTPSFDLIPNGELPGYNGGIEFTTTRADGTGTAYSPRRIRISEDGRIFVTSLNTDGNYLWEVNADNLNEWTPVFKGTLNDQRELITEDSAFIAAPNNGFDVKGSGENLQLAMYSVNLSGITAAAMSGFRLHEYNLGTATEWATAPSKTWVEGKYAINYTGTQVEYDNEGGLWICSYRGTASDANPGLVHINADGVEDAKLVWNNVRQAGIRFNKDFTKLVVAGNNGAAKKATIYSISKDANGAPVLTEETVIDMAVVGNNLNDFAWDYAGNLYSCGNSAEKLAAWAMPYSGEVVTPAAAKYAFQLEGTGSGYEVYEDEITNLVIDLDNLVLIGGPSSAFQVDVFLGLGDYNRNDDTYQLLPESSIAVMGSDATFIEGYAYEVDAFTPSAKAVVRCEWNGMLLEFHLTMTAEPMEATKVVVENAVVEIEKYVIFGDVYDYALKMSGEWINPEDGLTYPVLVEVPVYYPEATEPSEIMSTVTVGGWGDNDPWLGFGEGTLTVTTETLSAGNKLITATGIVQNPMAGVAIDITISGTITPTGVENATVTVKPVKMIQNGQLIIEKDGVQYNANGAIVK